MATDPDPGRAPLPDEGVGTRPLPIVVRPRATVWHRVHRQSHGPLHFGPRSPPSGRYDDPTCGFGTPYVGETLEVAFVEAVLRNPRLRMVSLTDLAGRRRVTIRARRDLRLVDFSGAGLSAVGTTGAVNTGSYRVSQAWAAALHDHPEAPDGILYRSRHDPSLCCAAIFDRAGPAFTAGASEPLEVEWLASTLTQYGKVLTP